jgi:tetratricopeptide (TPR) repeat protein
MNLRHALGSLLMIAIGGLPVFGQALPTDRPTYSIAGWVRDDTDQRMETVLVSLKEFAGGTVRTTFTRVNGEFQFDVVPPGEYFIVVHVDGYEPFEKTVTVARAPVQGLDVSLRKPVTVKPKEPSRPVSAHELRIPGKPRGEFEKGLNLLYSKSDYRGAIAQFERAIKHFPNYYEAYAEEGNAYTKLKDLPAAEQAFRKSIELSSSQYADALFQLAGLLNNTERFAEAEPLARQNVTLAGTAWEGHYELARALLGLQRSEEAEKSAIEARDLKPDLAPVFLVLANIHIARHDYAALLQDLDSYVKLVPTGPEADQARRTQKQLQEAMQKGQAQPHLASDVMADLKEVGATGASGNIAPSSSASTQGEQASVEKPADKTLASPRGQRTKADRWYPQDVDWGIPQVTPGAACPLTDVLSRAGKRIQELVDNVDKFTATEVVEHQSVDKSGRLRPPEIRKFNYLVSIGQTPEGYLNVEEFRNRGSNPDQFPDRIATVGTPSLILIFHPNHAKDFRMTCEGLGHWQDRPAWQVRFEERTDRRSSISVLIMGGRAFGLRLHGRAWILADSYQVARLESDLADEIPQIRLHLQHQDIEYHPVHFDEGKIEIWLPSSTALYMDFLGHRFYRRHRFTDFQIFSVKLEQTLGNPKE